MLLLKIPPQPNSQIVKISVHGFSASRDSASKKMEIPIHIRRYDDHFLQTPFKDTLLSVSLFSPLALLIIMALILSIQTSELNHWFIYLRTCYGRPRMNLLAQKKQCKQPEWLTPINAGLLVPILITHNNETSFKHIETKNYRVDNYSQ